MFCRTFSNLPFLSMTNNKEDTSLQRFDTLFQKICLLTLSKLNYPHHPISLTNLPSRLKYYLRTNLMWSFVFQDFWKPLPLKTITLLTHFFLDSAHATEFLVFLALLFNIFCCSASNSHSVKPKKRPLFLVAARIAFQGPCGSFLPADSDSSLSPENFPS